MGNQRRDNLGGKIVAKKAGDGDEFLHFESWHKGPQTLHPNKVNNLRRARDKGKTRTVQRKQAAASKDSLLSDTRFREPGGPEPIVDPSDDDMMFLG